MAEADSLDAAKVALEELFQVQLGPLDRKDSANHEHKEIEGVWTSLHGGAKFAVEHTSVDLFERQREVTALFEPIRVRLLPQLSKSNPDARIQVLLSTELLAKGRRKMFTAAEPEIVAQINALIDQTQPGQKSVLLLKEVSSKVYIESIPYHKAGTGFLVLGLALTDDLMSSRVDRFFRAINEKCPKLGRYKRSGCCTVLVLEDVEPDNSTFENFRALFDHLSFEPTFLPDVILYVERNHIGVSGISQMKIGERWFDYTDTTNFLSPSAISDSINRRTARSAPAPLEIEERARDQ